MELIFLSLGPPSQFSTNYRLGYESILQQVFYSIGLTAEDLSSFFSGPAFLAWNRFGNIQGSWGNESLPQSWINREFLLSQQIITRMVDLGMTPVLPAFTGFVPENITRVVPNATVVRGSEWNGFGDIYSNVTFLEPFDPLFDELQAKVINIQKEVYGAVSNVYTLDQYNENTPYSGDTDYLRNISRDTMGSLTKANPDAVWLMQVSLSGVI
jgi:alpha-N-acetylglucosaminidase